jgi:AraC-like DNA-binding protein
VKDGNIYTSAGISAGIDLALAWVEEDCGVGLAHEAARELVLFLRRPGGQPQVSVSLASQASEMISIRELQIWIAEHLPTKLSVEDLADRMSMSVRNFERVFTREVDTTPSQYVLQMRVEAARRQLERTERGLKQVASTAGFGNVDVMRRAFVRLLGITRAAIANSRTIRTANDGRTTRATCSASSQTPAYGLTRSQERRSQVLVSRLFARNLANASVAVAGRDGSPPSCTFPFSPRVFQDSIREERS